MTHTDRRPLFRRPVLVVLACLLALASTLGLRPSAARADASLCGMWNYTLVPTGPIGHDLTQPPDYPIDLSIHTISGDTLGASCDGLPLRFTWSVDNLDPLHDGVENDGSHIVFVSAEEKSVTIRVQVTTDIVASSHGAAEITLSFVDGGPMFTTVAASPATIDAGQTTTLTSSTTSYSGVSSVLWDFGDGTPQALVQAGGTPEATTTSVDHEYQNPGDYTALVLITDPLGRTDAADEVVHVRAPLVGGFTLSPDPVRVGAPVSVDGSAASTDPDASVTGYSWDFGDGHSGTGATADHAYSAAGTYTITETVTDSLDRTATATHDVTVLDVPADTPPVAAWQVTTPAPEAGSPTAFDGTGSTDDGTITGYRWDFGDGHTGTTAAPEHVYDAAGTYTVVLTVTDEAGLTDSVTHTVTVADTVASPTAAFTVNPASPVAGSPVTFDASSSTEPGSALTDYSWAFGDGTTGSGVTQSHTYAAAGTYQATLTVTDSRGRTAPAVRSVTVHWKPADLAVSVSGSTPRAGLYTYRVTVRNLGSAAAHGVVLLNTPDKTQLLASAPSAPAGLSCAGVRIGATGTITCKAAAATVLGAGKAWTVTYTVKQSHLARPRLVTETSQVKAANPDPIPTNNTARLGTTAGAVL